MDTIQKALAKALSIVGEHQARNPHGGMHMVREHTRLVTASRAELVAHLHAIKRMQKLATEEHDDPIAALTAVGEHAKLAEEYPPQRVAAIEGEMMAHLEPMIRGEARDRTRRSGHAPAVDDHGNPTGFYGDMVGEGRLAALAALRAHDPDAHASTLESRALGEVRKRLFHQWRGAAGAAPLVGQDTNMAMSKQERTRSALAVRLGRSPSTDELAAELGTTAAKVEELERLGEHARSVSTDAPVGGESDGPTLGDTLSDHGGDPAEALGERDYLDNMTRTVREALAGITDVRDHYAIKLKFGMLTAPDIEAMAEHYDLPRLGKAVQFVRGERPGAPAIEVAYAALAHVGERDDPSAQRLTQAIALVESGGDYQAMLTPPDASTLFARLGYNKNTASKVVSKVLAQLRANPSIAAFHDENTHKSLVTCPTPEAALFLAIVRGEDDIRGDGTPAPL